MYQKILQLLAHEDDANVLLGLEIASGLTSPESIDEEVFHLAYFHPSQEVNTRAFQFLNDHAHIDLSKVPPKTWEKIPEKDWFWHSSKEIDLILDWLEALPISFELINADFLNKILHKLNIEQRAGQVFLFCVKHQISLQDIPALTACTEMSFYLNSHQGYEYDRKLPKRSLQTLPKEIGQMTNLTHLILDNHQLTELPEEIGELTKLNYLYLNHNALNRLPESFAKLANLARLELNHNPLGSFPAEVLSCKNLHTLLVKNGGFETLPAAINQLSRLENLDLGYNKLNSLPRQFGHLTKLQEVNLSNNQLDKLPICFIKLTNLTHLNLANNKIERLPGRFSQLHNLTDLDLRNNCLKYWHFSGHTLFNLKWLDLSDNQLTRLTPTTIGLLASLECLRVNDNPLPRKELAQFKAQFPEIYMLPLIPPREWSKHPRALISADLAREKVPVNLSYQGKFTIEFDISSTKKYVKLSW
ncbi:MAG TPA: hypothetical protein DCS93_12860 [Microscillaceae bacterium]|nr:hypothetical protein [Microscillaceae bacterium]